MKTAGQIGDGARALTGMLAQPLALLAVAIGLLVTGALYASIRTVEQQRMRTEFERRAATRVAAVREELNEAVAAVETVNRLFVAMAPVGREQFGAFTRPMLEDSPQLRLIAFQRVVAGSERAAFERARRAEFPGFGIGELAGASVVSAAPRASYRVVDYLEPMAGNESTFGLDAATRAEQDAAARRACETGRAAMTGQYGVVLGNSLQQGFMVIMPVYRAGVRRAGCAAVEGFTVAAVSSAALVAQTLANPRMQAAPDLEVSVYEGAGADPARRVLRVGPLATAQPSALARLAGGGSRHVGQSFEVAGRPWRVEVSEQPGPLPRHSLGSLLMLVGGTICTLLAAACAGAASRRTRSVYRLVKERTAALSQANRTQQLLRQAIEASYDSIIITSAEPPGYPIQYVNPAFEQMSGYRADEVIGRSCTMFWGEEKDEPGVRALGTLARARREGTAVVRTRRKDGGELWSEAHIAPFKDASGAVRHFVVAQYDVTEKRRYESELEYQATHDPLTGLANRDLLYRRLREATEAAGREGQAVWVLFIDVDRFKFVTDSLGHRAGDAFLQAIAQRLLSAARPEDTLARLGGDEFILVVPERGAAALDAGIPERILEAIARPVSVGSQELFLSACVGVARYPADSDDPATLIDFADLAMHRAKELGRNNYQLYRPEMIERAQWRLKMERDLRSALERDEFELHYQPQLDLSSGRVVGVEALLRWRHPELGLLTPRQFLVPAEDTGLIVPIGAWAMRRACAQVRRWQDEGHAGLRLALNLSLRELNQDDLAGQVGAVLADTGLAACHLELELNERMVMRDWERAVEVMNALRALGAGIAVDDFGAGHSSLAQLRRFPVNALKIDHSFVHALSGEGNDAAIPAAIISLAHSLGMRVIAEGVETDSQCEILARNMCDEIQGKLFSPALDEQAAGALLAAGRGLPAQLLRMHKRERTLLLVDDEPNILAALRRQLRGAGMRILTAPGGREGMALLETEHVDVILSDQRMPDMTGVEFLRAVKTSHPDTVRMVLSGFTELQSVTDAVNEGAIYKFLTKPWDDTQLRGHIQEAFAHKEMADENRRLDLQVRTANHGLAQVNRQLEEMLQQQKEQISRTGISLDIVREALQHVPLPILGLDEEQVVAFANVAAQRLLGQDGMALGGPVEWFMPALAEAAEGRSWSETLHGTRYEIAAHSMGKGTRARGRLIIFKPVPTGEAITEE
ncbi:EAL domain-containing protein [Massilia cavernae]|uniref:EAL domain-containing protein n=1 Tax=Massilia cavernae TaxID=2320864 RepID=A0A418Y6B7_9BURK|nr:EAL domain-containing protein [Massilia cavernae]RJG23425.1 EAL domain-containing protein [Massilia cavernae]